ncbi:MAG: LacI family DNA-binding transcriptional regulator [Anaerolineales bacterium]|nr:LacI family DNA-binding transcriptional regulator [Anaerolineales bacterium]
MYNNKRATIKQVAKAAGVSTQTVSRVINNRPDVAPETRERVRTVIDEMGYQPSALARSLIQQRSYTLGVVTAGLKYIGPSRTLNGITSQAETMGYTLLLKELSHFDTEDIEPIVSNLLSRHVDGIVWAVPEVGENHQWVEHALTDIPVPIVFLTMEKRPKLSIVKIDNYFGAKVATEHLLQQGYRHIGHISGPMDWWESRQRKAGWSAALQEAGLTVADSQCAEGNWSSSSGESAFIKLRSQFPEMDAIFVANDQMALSVLQQACRQGISVPAQLGVVGFDGLAESPYYWPSLTTVVQDQHLLGCTTVEEIVRVIEQRRGKEIPTEPQTIIFQPELAVRNSSIRSK